MADDIAVSLKKIGEIRTNRLGLRSNSEFLLSELVFHAEKICVGLCRDSIAIKISDERIEFHKCEEKSSELISPNTVIGMHFVTGNCYRLNYLLAMARQYFREEFSKRMQKIRVELHTDIFWFTQL